MRTVHTKEKPYECRHADCKSMFNTNSGRRRHEKKAHNLELPKWVQGRKSTSLVSDPDNANAAFHQEVRINKRAAAMAEAEAAVHANAQRHEELIHEQQQAEMINEAVIMIEEPIKAEIVMQ